MFDYSWQLYEEKQFSNSEMNENLVNHVLGLFAIYNKICI
jgi:ribosomal protein S19